jgi:hypothetical protein
MTEWTDSAKRVLDNYFGRMRTQLHASGADPREVIDDLGRHIDQEIAASNLRVVTEQDVRQILSRIGAPDAMATVAVKEPPAGPPPPRRKKHPMLLFFGVILPAITLGIELATHMCAGVFFDPIPTWWHVALVGAAIAANAFAWKALRDGTQFWNRLMISNGVAVAVSFFFALLYLPLAPLAIIAIVFFGWGFLPLAPIFCCASALAFRNRLKRLAPDYAPRYRWGLVSATIVVAIVAIPAPLTRYLASKATSEDPATSRSAVKWLRAIGSRDTLLRDSYGSTQWSRDPVMGFSVTGTPVATEEARNLYFRVTGKPFNSVPAPQRNFARGGWDELDGWTWDTEQGGDAVGALVKGVTMSQSRMDGLIDGDAGWAYTEWTLEFKNVSERAQEARAQIALPPDAVVSRLTLWVNGEEREAAFAGEEHVRKAYRDVAVVQRRDPVLVTSYGPDRVLMQCFPVPADGGTIKVRLGITSPLEWESASESSFTLPYFLERNFGIASEQKHSLWLESSQRLIAGKTPLTVESPRTARFAARGSIGDSQLAGSKLRIQRDAAAKQFWTADPAAVDGAIMQRLVEKPVVPPKHLVLVVDGSESMRAHLDDVAEALRDLPNGMFLSMVVADDGAREVLTRATNPTTVAEALRRLRLNGGHDNVEALVRAWDLAGTDGVVLWIHAAQPILLSNLESLQQRVFWKSSLGAEASRRIHDLQVAPGPNRVVEKLDAAWASFATVAKSGNPADDLRGLFSRWSARRTFEWSRERIPSAEGLASSEKNSKHLARLWAFDKTKVLILAKQTGEAIRIAGTYQLVTPVTGAVVLESKQQFDQAGLTAVDSHTVPTVPEPATWLLAALGVVALFLARRQIALRG